MPRTSRDTSRFNGVHTTHRAIAAAIRAAVPVHIEGTPGTAKTASLAAWGTAWGRHVETITGSSRDKGDFMGMPVETDGVTSYSPPQWVRNLQATEDGILVLDELQSSSESFAISLRIVQEKVVGEAHLPAGTSIVAISNPIDQAVDGMELPAPVANRFMHTTWHLDFDEWAYGLATGFEDTNAPDLRQVLAREADVPANYGRIQAQIVGFLTNRPDMRNACPTDPYKASKGWPSNRSWHNAARAIAHLRHDDLDARDHILTGCVGEAAMTEFVAWTETCDLIDPMEALNDPDRVDWSGERPDRLFALLTSIKAVLAADLTKPTWRSGVRLVTRCAEAGKPDVAAPLARYLFSRVPDDTNIPRDARDAFDSLFQRLDGSRAATLV